MIAKTTSHNVTILRVATSRELGSIDEIATKDDLIALYAGLKLNGNRSRDIHYQVRDWPEAFELAAALDEVRGSSANRVVAIDAGPGVHPRFGVHLVPAQHDPVSYAFNGDSYPDGLVISVGHGPRAVITTDTGSRYYRYKLTARWIKQGGTWNLVRGHISSYNREL